MTNADLERDRTLEPNWLLLLFSVVLSLRLKSGSDDDEEDDDDDDTARSKLAADMRTRFCFWWKELVASRSLPSGDYTQKRSSVDKVENVSTEHGCVSPTYTHT